MYQLQKQEEQKHSQQLDAVRVWQSDHNNPATMETIIGFLSKPTTIVLPTPVATWSRRLPAIAATIILPKNTRSTVSINRSGATARSPKTAINIGNPRKPRLPITAHCASTDDSLKLHFLVRAIAKTNR